MKRLATVIVGLSVCGGCGTHTAIGQLGDSGVGGGPTGSGGTGDVDLSDAGLGGGPAGIGGAIGGVDGGGIDAAGCSHGAAGAPGATPASVVAFAYPMDYPNMEDYSTMGVFPCDLDGDGKMDVIVRGRVDFSTRLNLGGGRLGPAVHYAQLGSPSGLACGDLDGDGSADVVMTNGRVVVWRNDGHGALGTPVTYAAGRVRGRSP